jgi:type II secretory pathway pseudopilin PulG
MMTMRRYNRLKGVTLLETMLAVSLIVLGVILGVGQYQKVALQRKAAQIQNSVVLLGNALEQYYSVNCYYFLTQYSIYPIDPYTNPAIVPEPSSSGDPQNPTLATYIATPQLIGNPYAVNPNGPAAYTYTINVKGDIPVLSISTQFSAATSSTILSVLQGKLKPNVVKNKQFTWYTALHRSLASQATGLNTNLSYLQAMAPGQKQNVSSRQLASQYMVSGDQFANVCAYWQQPQYRCTITGDNTRCDYQNKPS